MRRWSAPVSGVLLTGAIFAAITGITLLPFSVPGILFMGLGLLGFIPFLTSFVYLRNGIRAFRQAKTHMNWRWVTAAMLVGVFLVTAIPAFANWQASQFVAQSIRAILGSDPQQAEYAARTIKYAIWCSDECYSPIVAAYRDETAGDRRVFLARLYKEITGYDIEVRLRSAFD